ncbi:hypothetical protein, partial [Dickeya dadantii]|uniref:hypothetical protein n=1 Tax=Dickeya dadantii TaxID=204038 RepID=UPI001C12DC4E
TEPTEPSHFCLSINICVHKNHDWLIHCQRESAQNETERRRLNAQCGSQWVRISVRTANHTATRATPDFIQFEINFLVGEHV